MPIKYYVSQGHIVDENLTISSQLDLIIADNSGSPVLFTSENGTEYFPYESIYSFAEIKSTYYTNKKYLEAFIKSTKSIYENLKRKDTPHTQLSQDIGLNFGNGMSVNYNDNRPYKNPLFKFMFFANSNNFQLEQIKELLKKTDDKYLPNLIVLLDKSIIAKAKILDENGEKKLGPVELFPEFIKDDEKDNYKWVNLEFETEENRATANFAFLIFALNTHFKKCLVMRPNLLEYFSHMFKHQAQIIE